MVVMRLFMAFRDEVDNFPAKKCDETHSTMNRPIAMGPQPAIHPPAGHHCHE